MPQLPRNTQAAQGDTVPAMLNVSQVAKLLGISERHVRRLVDRGRFPRPVRLGWLTRWPQRVLDQWIDAGCPACGGQCSTL